MVKVGGVITAGSGMSCSCEAWIASSINLLCQRAYSDRWWNCYPGGAFSGNPYMAAERRGGFADCLSNLGRTPKLGTMIGNSVENKGFSTALILRPRSTIWFGHASAASYF